MTEKRRPLATGVRFSAMPLREPTERTVPQWLKPSNTPHCGTAEAVPFRKVFLRKLLNPGGHDTSGLRLFPQPARSGVSKPAPDLHLRYVPGSHKLGRATL